MQTFKPRHQRTIKLLADTGILAAVTILIVPLLTTPALAGVQTIETRPGVTVDVLAEVPEGAGALVLLFEGAQGMLLPGSKGFAHKAYPIFLRQGMAAALIDAPTDRSGFRGGLGLRFRESRVHMSDIDAAIRALKQRYALPVWILGTSHGTRSAATYAMFRSKEIAGVVLTSSSTAPPNGDPIHQQPGIKGVSVPLLAVAHLGDQCVGTPPAGAAEIARAATGSPAAVAMLFTGGLNAGPSPCGVETHHAFYGIEESVVAAIIAFIIGHTAGEAQLSTAQPK